MPAKSKASKRRARGGPGESPLWRCPKCGKRFVTRNLWHSCARISVREHLWGRSPQVVRLYRGFAALVRKCGPVIVSPSKTDIAFQVRMRFAGCRLGAKSLHAAFLLMRAIESPRITRVEYIPPRYHVHHLQIRDPAELNRELLAWLRQAYAMGQQKRLRT